MPILSFNPHAHEGRDFINVPDAGLFGDVSIRTPMKGAITLTPLQTFSNSSFNPHAHEGRDNSPCDRGDRAFTVSIRTPMKGAIYNLLSLQLV